MAVSPLALVLLVPALVVALLYLFRRPAPHPQDGRQPPPSPGRGLPLIGHLHLLGSLPHRELRALAAAYGPVMLLRFGRMRTVVVSSASAAEEVMRTRDLAFASRARSAVAERLLYGRDVAFAPYGEYWRQARRICVVHLLSARRTLSFRRVQEQEAAALVRRVRDASAALDVCELIVAYANTVVTRAAFGVESARGLYRGGDRGRELRKVFDDFAQLLGTAPLAELVPCLGWVDAVRGVEGRIGRTFEALDGVLEMVIDDRRRRRQPDAGSRKTDDDGGVDDHKDFVDVLLDVNETDAEAGIRLDTTEIKAIILAGHVRGGHGHDEHGDRVGNGGAHHAPGQHAQAPGRDPGDRGRRRGRHRGPSRQAALPQRRGQGDAAPAPSGPAPRAPRAAQRRRDPRLPRPGAHAGDHQRVGHRPRPGDLGARRGVRAGAVPPGQGRGGLQGGWCRSAPGGEDAPGLSSPLRP